MAAFPNLQGLIEAYRSRIDDLPGDSEDTDWLRDDSGLMWSNDELVRYANEAQDEYCVRRPIDDRSTASVCQISVSLAGGAIYPLDSRILYVRRAWLDGESSPLVKRTAHHLDLALPGWQDADPGGPRWYVESQEPREIRLVRPPDGDYTLMMEVGRLPLQALRWTHRHKDAPEIPSHHWPVLFWYMDHLAYAKRDTETHNKGRSENGLAMFESLVGPRPSAYIEEVRRRERNLTRRARASWF